MKVLRFTFLYLIIYILNSTFLNAQNLALEITGKDATETRIIDSLIFKTNFTDYSSLKRKLISLIQDFEKMDTLKVSSFLLTKKMIRYSLLKFILIKNMKPYIYTTTIKTLPKNY